MIAAPAAPARSASVVLPVSTAVPGRVRVRVPSIRSRPSFARQLEDRLGADPGVRFVRVNPTTGSVLVLFDPGRARPRSLVDRLRRHLRDLAAGVAAPGEAPAGAWHAEPAAGVLARLDTSAERGLASDVAAARLAAFGANRLPTPEPRTAVQIVTGHLSSLPVVLLAGASVLSLAGGAPLEAIAILGVVAANTVVGYLTESRVERTLASLQQGEAAQAVVRRDGAEATMPAAALVPGDVVALQAGRDVPADARLTWVNGLAVDQSALTGETAPAAKHTAPTPLRTVLPERSSMVYAGTRVAEGSGLGVVTATGRHTEIGHVRALLSETATPETPLERQLDRVGRSLVAVSLGLCGVTLGLGLLRGVPALEMLRTVISLAVAAVPEGLPAVATTTLALGMQRMMRQGMLVRRLSAVESLGATTVICADKTGTLTENRMSVHAWHLAGRDYANGAVAALAPSDPVLARALAIGVLCNEAELDASGAAAVGSSTEGALLAAALDAGLDYRIARERHRLIDIRRRADGENWMATVHAGGAGRRLVAVKGAPEQVIRRSTHWLDETGIHRVTADVTRDALVANARLAAQGLRVLGLAYREDDGAAGEPGEPGYEDLVWVGLVGLTDPVRPGVREAIAACRRAGIRTVILTGDQGATAAAVSRELELHGDREPRTLDAAQFGDDAREAFRERARDTDVFSRVSPADKYRIVRAFQEHGEIVAMTGDGINDAAALRAADVGVAMGAGGTDVAREVADVVLLDDDLGAMVKAVEQGRTIRRNVGRALEFLLATNLSEILVTLGALAAGGERPMSAMQFLWINLLSDVAPALALAVEPADPEVMTRPPDDPSASLLSRRVLIGVGADAGLLAAATLAVHGVAAGRYGAGPRATSVAFSTLTSAQLLHALRYRARGGRTGLGASPLLLGVVGGSVALQAGAQLLPPLRRLLGLTPLSLGDWLLAGAGAVAPLVASEIVRALTGTPSKRTRSHST